MRNAKFYVGTIGGGNQLRCVRTASFSDPEASEEAAHYSGEGSEEETDHEGEHTPQHVMEIQKP